MNVEYNSCSMALSSISLSKSVGSCISDRAGPSFLFTRKLGFIYLGYASVCKTLTKYQNPILKSINFLMKLDYFQITFNIFQEFSKEKGHGNEISFTR